MSEWSNLAKVVFRRTYARKDSGSLENFNDTVHRVIEGNVRGHGVSQQEIEKLYYFLGNRKAGPAGRGWWFSGAPSHSRIGGAALCNPFDENTKILTKEYGWIAIGEVEGQNVHVLSSTWDYGSHEANVNCIDPPKSVWAEASISHGEVQPTLTISMEDRYGNQVSLTASENHRWFRRHNTKGSWERVASTELEAGNYLPIVKPTDCYDLSPQAILHGAFLGDGTRCDNKLHLFGNKRQLATKLLAPEQYAQGRRDDELVISACPLAWNSPPAGAYKDDKRYVYGFLAGYFATDGSVHSKGGHCRIHSARLDELTVVVDLFRFVGIRTSDPIEVRAEGSGTNYTKDSKALYEIRITAMDLRDSFFVRDDQREEWKKHLGSTKRDWYRITKIESSGNRRVLCATVPGYGQFVVDGFVLTSNCWSLAGDDWMNFVSAADLLMLGGGVGMSVEHRYVSKLPKVKKGVCIRHKPSTDAIFIVPDSREGWVELIRRTLKAYFYDGKSFDYSTVCIRGAGESIKGFGGTSSGPIPLIGLIDKMSKILGAREGKNMHPIDAADILCAIAEMVVSGNVRRSALIVMGDPFDKEFLKAKRWDLGQLPSQRSNANFSVVCEDVEDLHPLFWKTYEIGEPFGIVNRSTIQKYGRMGEIKKDTATLTNPCFAPGTLVHTRQGDFPIEQLVGQSVEIWDGTQWTMVDNFRVTATNQPILKLTFQDGSETRLTPYHKAILQNGTRIEARELRVGDVLEASTAPESHGSHSEPGAYIKGFLVGDGSLSDGNARLALYSTKYCCGDRLLSSAQQVPVSGIRTNAIKELELGQEDKQKRKWMQGLSVRKDLVPWSSVYKKNLPPDIYSWDKDSKFEFIAGVMDADGTACDNGGGFKYQICSIHKAWLQDFQNLLKTIGVRSKLSLMKKGGKKDFNDGYGEYNAQDCWRLNISQASSIHLSSQVTFSRLVSFSSKTLSHKSKPKHTKVVSIAEDGVEEKVYCCTVNTTHSFSLTNGIHWMNCGEATLESGESCNLQNIALPNLTGVDEFEEASRLMHRWGKRVTMEKYHIPQSDEVIKRNRRTGTSITGCLKSPLFVPAVLDRAYDAIQDENVRYSKELGIPESIRTTTVNPAGTISKVYDMDGYEGIHAAYSRYMIQRIRFSSTDPAVPLLRQAGHHIEPVIKLDGTLDHSTVVVDFYVKAPEAYPVADDGNWDTWKQLDILKMAQRHWADQAVSVTVYYKKEEISQLKSWLADNLKYIKGVSFLCHQDHGFKQAPKEAITREQFERLSGTVKPLDADKLQDGADLEGTECAGGACPLK